MLQTISVFPEFYIDLPADWKELKDVVDVAEFIDYSKPDAGVLQISRLEKKRIERSRSKLLLIAEKVALDNFHFGTFESESGKCDLGLYGAVISQNVHIGHVSVWILSDNNNLILATYMRKFELKAQELITIRKMILSVKRRRLLVKFADLFRRLT